MGWKQDHYIPKNPDKYLGDPNKIFFRSSWEERAFYFCDNNPNVIAWASEEIKIPYMFPNPNSPTKMSTKNYYPDLYIEFNDAQGKRKKLLVEIKPEKQTRPSRARKQAKALAENYTYVVNQCKWDAAKKWCESRGVTFEIWTEEDIFNK